jgi:hypothetical protein
MKKLDLVGIVLLILAVLISFTMVYQAYLIKQRNLEAEKVIQGIEKTYDSLLKARNFKNV